MYSCTHISQASEIEPPNRTPPRLRYTQERSRNTSAEKIEGTVDVAKQGIGIKQAAADLGVSAKWIRDQIAAGVVEPTRSSGKRNARYQFSPADLEALQVRAEGDPTASGPALLARYNQLEAERANLLAQVAWERAIAQEQQKALQAEQARSERLGTELEHQRARVEALKSLSAWDRVRGRHKAI